MVVIFKVSSDNFQIYNMLLLIIVISCTLEPQNLLTLEMEILGKLFSSKKKLSPSVFMTNSHIHMPFDSLGIQFSSVAQSCLTLCNPMECSTPSFPVHQQLPELAQTHVHPGSDAIQPSHPLLSPSPPAFNLSQHQGLFK